MRSDAGPVAVDREFFESQLPRIRDLAELKVALHVRQLASSTPTGAVPVADLFDPSVVRSIAGTDSAEPAVERARRAIERALADGLILRLTVHEHGAAKVYLLVGTTANRDLLDRLRAGDVEVEQRLGLPAGVEGSVYRPNVFALYERHIGPLTPLVADQLREAERAYPREWIERAMLEAVRYERRSWRYVEAVLSSWEESGSPDAGPGRFS